MENAEYIVNSDILIRRALPDEFKPAMEMVWKVFGEFEAKDYGPEGTANFRDFINGDIIKNMFDIGEYPMWVATCKGRIVGVSTLRVKTHISLLFVDKEYQRMGIGRTLIKAMQDHTEERGSIKLTVNSSPVGEGFYRKVGFMDTDARKYTNGIIYTPMILLERL